LAVTIYKALIRELYENQLKLLSAQKKLFKNGKLNSYLAQLLKRLCIQTVPS